MGLFFKTIKDSFERFWAWFQENEDRIYDFEKDQERIFDELSYQLSLVDSNLTFEFSSTKDNGRREFIISADGIKSSFATVEELVEKAPSLEKWTIIKYRPRRSTLNGIKFKNKSVNPEDVYFATFKDENPNKVGVILFFRDYSEEEKDTWGQIGFLILDEALGEYDVEIKVGAIVFKSIDSEYFKHARPIDELQEEFDRYFE